MLVFSYPFLLYISSSSSSSSSSHSCSADASSGGSRSGSSLPLAAFFRRSDERLQAVDQLLLIHALLPTAQLLEERSARQRGILGQDAQILVCMEKERETRTD